MIPLFKVHTPKNIGKKLQEVFDSGFLTEGKWSDDFEARFSEYIENENTCLLNSCTSALAIASRVIGIKPGDEVITTAMTCMATNEPFFNDGAKLVFADVEKLQITQEQNMTNKVNIEFLTKQLEKALKDIEELKDKVRANGNGGTH